MPTFEELLAQARAAGGSPTKTFEELLAEARGGVSVAGPDLAAAGAVPTSQIDPYGPRTGIIDDLVGAAKLAPAAFKEEVVGPFAGLFERAGFAEEGTRRRIREEFDTKRREYLYGGDSPILRSILATGIQGAAALVPLAPAGPIGKAAAKGSKLLGAGKSLSRLAAGAAAGAVEGSIIAAGNEPLYEGGSTGGRTLLSVGGGALFGGLGAKVALERGDVSPVVDGFLRRYFKTPDGETKPLEQIVAEEGQRWVDKYYPVTLSARKAAAVERAGGNPRMAGDIERQARVITHIAENAFNAKKGPVVSAVRDEVTREVLAPPLMAITSPMNSAKRTDFGAYLAATRQVDDVAARSLAAEKVEKLRTALGRQLKKADAPNSKMAELVEDLDMSVSALSVDARPAREAMDDVLSAWEVDDIAGMKAALGRVRGEALRADPQATADSHAVLADIAKRYGMDERGRIRELADAADQFHHWERAMLKGAVDVGTLNPREAERMIAANPNWVSLRFADQGIGPRGSRRGLGAGGTPVKDKRLILGLSEERKSVPVLEQSAAYAMRLHQFYQHQKARNYVVALAEAYPDALPGVRRATREEIKSGQAFSVFDHADESGNVFASAKRRYWTAPDDMMKALNSIPPKLLGTEPGSLAESAVKVAAATTRGFKAGVTLPVRFAVKNVLRDPIQALTYSRHGMMPQDIVAGLVEVVLGKTGIKETPAFKEFMDGAGRFSTFLGQDIVAAEGADFEVAHRALGKRVDARWLNPVHTLREIGNVLEMPSRFAEFKLARQGGRKVVGGIPVPFTRGKGHAPLGFDEASLDAADVTLPFAKMGTSAKQWNMLEAFFNANIRDVDRFGQAMTKEGVGPRIRALAYLTVPAMANWAANHDNPEYQALPEWEKLLFLHLPAPPGVNWRFTRVPLPPGILTFTFAYLPQKLADMAAKYDPYAAGTVMERLADTQVGPQIAHGLVESTPLQYVPFNRDRAIEALPNAAQPFAEIAANRNPFFESQVIGRSLEGLDPEEQQFPETSPTSVAMADALRRMGAQNVSALHVDHLVRGYGGTIGQQARGVLDSGLHSVGVGQERLRMPPGGGAVGSAMQSAGLLSTRVIGMGSAPVQAFYELAASAEAAERTAKKKALSNPQALENYYERRPEAFLASELRDGRNTLAEMRELRTTISRDDSLATEEKVDALTSIDMQITQLSAFYLQMSKEMLDQVEQERRKRREMAAAAMPGASSGMIPSKKSRVP